MAAIWGSVFGVLSFGSSLASSIFAYKAYSGAGNIANGSSDSNISSARSLLLWAAVLAWVTLAIIVIIILLFVFYYRAAYSISGFIVLIAIVLFILTLVIGILCALAASRIRSSNLYTNSGAVYTAYWDAIVGAILSLVTAAFILIIFIIYLIAYSRGPATKAEVTPTVGAISIDDPVLKNKIAQEEKLLETEKANLIKAQEEARQAQSNVQRAQALLESEKTRLLKEQQDAQAAAAKVVAEQNRIAAEQLRLSELQKQYAAVLQTQSLAVTARGTVAPAPGVYATASAAPK